MIAKTRAIVLRNTNYSESSVISKMYTREFGLRSYLLQGIKKGKSAIRPAMIQPLSVLEMDVYEKSNSNLNRVKELKSSPVLANIQENILKKSVAIFMLEIINQCILEEQCEVELYDFLESQILTLENDDSVTLFPIRFLIKLTPFLGVEPQGVCSQNTPYLSLNDGIFIQEMGINVANEIISKHVSDLLNNSDSFGVVISNNQRKDILNTLVHYFQIHITKNKPIKSIEILAELLN